MGFYFSTKLAVLSNNLPHKKALTLPSLTSQPYQVLASDLVPYSDVQQVNVYCCLHLTQHLEALCNMEFCHVFCYLCGGDVEML